MPVVDYDDPRGGGRRNRQRKESIILTHKNVMVRGWEVRHYDDFLRYKNELLELFAFLSEVEEKVAPLLEVKLLDDSGSESMPGAETMHAGKEENTLLRPAVCRRGTEDAALYPDRKIVFYVCGNVIGEIDGRVCTWMLCPDAEFDVFAEGNPARDSAFCRTATCSQGAPEYILSMGFRLPRYTSHWIKTDSRIESEASFANFNRLFSRNNLISGMCGLAGGFVELGECVEICGCRLLLQASTEGMHHRGTSARKMYERKKYQPGLKIMAAKGLTVAGTSAPPPPRGRYTLSARSITRKRRSFGGQDISHPDGTRERSMVRPSTTGRE